MDQSPPKALTRIKSSAKKEGYLTTGDQETLRALAMQLEAKSIDFTRMASDLKTVTGAKQDYAVSAVRTRFYHLMNTQKSFGARGAGGAIGIIGTGGTSEAVGDVSIFKPYLRLIKIKY
jgi:hypothetical protein